MSNQCALTLHNFEPIGSGGADHEFAGAREFAGTREFAGEIPDFRDLAPANSRV